MTRMRVLLAVVSLAVAVGGGTAAPSQAMPPYSVASHCQELINAQVERGLLSEEEAATFGCNHAFNH